jgi:hypothetical protein
VPRLSREKYLRTFSFVIRKDFVGQASVHTLDRMEMKLFPLSAVPGLGLFFQFNVQHDKAQHF